MRAVLFYVACLLLAIASVEALRLPTPYRPGVKILDTCYDSYYTTGLTRFFFKWNTTKDPVLRANVAQWELQASDLPVFGGGSFWLNFNTNPDVFSYQYDFSNSGGLQCWGPLYIRVRALSSTGQTGPWSAVAIVKRGPLVPPKTTKIIVNPVAGGRINVAAV